MLTRHADTLKSARVMSFDGLGVEPEQVTFQSRYFGVLWHGSTPPAKAFPTRRVHEDFPTQRVVKFSLAAAESQLASALNEPGVLQLPEAVPNETKSKVAILASASGHEIVTLDSSTACDPHGPPVVGSALPNSRVPYL